MLSSTVVTPTHLRELHYYIIDSSHHLIGLRHTPDLRCMVEVLGPGLLEMGKRHEATEQLKHRNKHYALRHPQGLA